MANMVSWSEGGGNGSHLAGPCGGAVVADAATVACEAKWVLSPSRDAADRICFPPKRLTKRKTVRMSSLSAARSADFDASSKNRVLSSFSICFRRERRRLVSSDVQSRFLAARCSSAN